MTFIGSCITARGVSPIVKYQHKFASTYLYGSYSPIDGDSFVWEINGVSTKIFEAYLKAMSVHRPDEIKILVIDNAGFHSTKHIEIPHNIRLLRIPPYSPELNPCEQIWGWIKSRFKNKTFKDMQTLKNWLYETVNNMSTETIKSIVSNHHYLNNFNAAFSS
jgi:transposase